MKLQPEAQSKELFHCGHPIKEPLVGVIDNNGISHFGELIETGEDLSYHHHLVECDKDDHEDHAECYTETTIYLLGDWKMDGGGMWNPDREAGIYKFAAVASFDNHTTQVLWSETIENCELCSPCYPAQGSIGNEGQYKTFTFPDEFLV